MTIDMKLETLGLVTPVELVTGKVGSGMELPLTELLIADPREGNCGSMMNGTVVTVA